MTKKFNYQQNLENSLQFGQICRFNKRHKALPYAVSNMGQFTQVTYRCNICNSLQDTLYNTSWYIRGCTVLGLNPNTLKADTNTEEAKQE